MQFLYYTVCVSIYILVAESTLNNLHVPSCSFFWTFIQLFAVLQYEIAKVMNSGTFTLCTYLFKYTAAFLAYTLYTLHGMVGTIGINFKAVHIICMYYAVHTYIAKYIQ